ncbi:small ribosomal subunit protein mS33 isoform X1 [Neocloeon triangulifer]|uniref:small ribosomal subunit protein mS33 isoform X1 n=2 Tax=Neocloeon triangulifer TaxID=2078957 RepID=UPI00286F3E59|nr:small ribosomal subunit protein mS33 isoform X1 [Neocloeon triangulifer]
MKLKKVFLFFDSSTKQQQTKIGQKHDRREMSQINKYLALTNIATGYAKRMTRLRNRIFNEPVRAMAPRDSKVISLLSELPRQKDPEYTNYYPRHVETWQFMMKLRDYGLFRDEHQDFKEEMVRLRILRGKVKPKKGEGKRSKKK